MSQHPACFACKHGSLPIWWPSCQDNCLKSSLCHAITNTQLYEGTKLPNYKISLVSEKVKAFPTSKSQYRHLQKLGYFKISNGTLLHNQTKITLSPSNSKYKKRYQEAFYLSISGGSYPLTGLIINQV